MLARARRPVHSQAGRLRYTLSRTPASHVQFAICISKQSILNYSMKAMVLHAQRQPLQATDLPTPTPGPGQVLVQVRACAVCRTDLHVVDGELPKPKLPLVPGHEIVGVVAATGEGVGRFKPGDRVGVPWLGWTCGACDYCRTGRENLCDQARFTGYTLDGGYAEYAVANQRYCFPISDSYSDAEAAPCSARD